MNRLAGVWNLNGFPVEPEVVHTMMEAVAPPLSSPGELHVLAQEEVAMGYRPMLAVPSPGGGSYAEGGTRPLIVVSDARLDNRAQLSATLGLEAQGRSTTDAELIAHAYRRWGVDCAAHLLGDFAFVVWDPAERRLLCIRDHMGARPLYYQRTAHRFVFASEV
jgi:asparagine synthase (glutamine-hydrolysing)